MDPEENKENEDFGKVIDTLHSKQKLSSLRTYQGDMAEFIKDRNESVVSIALKERKGKEEKQKEEESKAEFAPRQAHSKSSIRRNFSMASLSFILLSLGGAAAYFVFNNLDFDRVEAPVVEEKLISYNDTVTFSGSGPLELGMEIANVFPSNGISIIEVASNGNVIEKSNDFFAFMGVTPPATLSRTLKDDYALGVSSRDGKFSKFIILTVNDFGRAFSGMLEWEASMEKDLSFLITKPLSKEIEENTDTEASSTPSQMPALPPVSENYFWKDIIVKNKDTRSLVNDGGQSKIGYSFLDKNTIIIVDNIYTIGDLSDIYVSHIVR